MQLREVRSEDLDRFFEHQQDPEANQMAAFAPRNPQDRGVFDYHWSRLLDDPSTTVRTIEQDGQVAGAIIVSGIGSSPELSFWTAREFWGQGITTSAVDALLETFTDRPLQAHVPADNIGSQKILTRRGFAVVGEDKNFSNARSEVVTELIMQLG
ncbi:GNAT family N-acetyltransferase [Citricoccus sp. GCM10030269]|uniref:GNAT family N-acetyltransferase n=1 Tax=Citricoccus sp. GCM10030269 TaxID=3273388 RepID=UPI00360CDD15